MSREQRIADIKARIQAGTYQVNVAGIADAMLRDLRALGAMTPLELAEAMSKAGVADLKLDDQD